MALVRYTHQCNIIASRRSTVMCQAPTVLLYSKFFPLGGKLVGKVSSTIRMY
jgi:hypothetical protein